MIRYSYDEELWYRKRKVLYHHHQSNDSYSIVYFVVATKDEVRAFHTHPNYFSDISRNVYFKVLTDELSRVPSAYTNREVAFMLEEEE